MTSPTTLDRSISPPSEISVDAMQVNFDSPLSPSSSSRSFSSTGPRENQNTPITKVSAWDQSPSMWMIITAALIGAVGVGWAFEAYGAPLAMPAFKQYFNWTNNCILIDNIEEIQSAGSCEDRYPNAPSWDSIAANGELCIDGCCCDENADVNSKMLSGLLGSLGHLGAALGSLSMGPLADKFGRLPAYIIANGMMLLGGVIGACSTSMWMLIPGRLLVGMAQGAHLVIAPLYLIEVASIECRGVFGVTPMIGLTLGQLLAAAYNIPAASTSNGWRGSFGGVAIPAGIACIVLAFAPETPRFCLVKGQAKAAHNNCQKLRGSHWDVDEEIGGIIDDLKANPPQNVWTMENLKNTICSKSTRWPAIAMLMLHFFQQASGMDAMIFFAPTIYEVFVSPVNAQWCMFGQVSGEVLASILSIPYLYRWGRKKLLLISGVIMMAMLFLIGLLLIGYNFDGPPTNEYPNGSPPYLNDNWIGYVVIIAMWILGAAFVYGWASIPPIVAAEYLDQSSRSLGMAICGCVAWTTAGLVAVAFPYLLDVHGIQPSGTFIILGLVALSATLFSELFIMETKDVSIEAIPGELTKYHDNHRLMKLARKVSSRKKRNELENELENGAIGREPRSQYIK